MSDVEFYKKFQAKNECKQQHCLWCESFKHLSGVQCPASPRLCVSDTRVVSHHYCPTRRKSMLRRVKYFSLVPMLEAFPRENISRRWGSTLRQIINKPDLAASWVGPASVSCKTVCKFIFSWHRTNTSIDMSIYPRLLSLSFIIFKTQLSTSRNISMIWIV